MIGFTSEADSTAVAYDFVPRGEGTSIIINNFGNSNVMSTVGELYEFGSVVYDYWRFAVSVKVDPGITLN